jgi:hypothetical protein
VHADSAAVNVNIWITDDEANLDQNSGGLVVYATKVGVLVAEGGSLSVGDQGWCSYSQGVVVTVKGECWLEFYFTWERKERHFSVVSEES